MSDMQGNTLKERLDALEKDILEIRSKVDGVKKTWRWAFLWLFSTLLLIVGSVWWWCKTPIMPEEKVSLEVPTPKEAVTLETSPSNESSIVKDERPPIVVEDVSWNDEYKILHVEEVIDGYRWKAHVILDKVDEISGARIGFYYSCGLERDYPEPIRPQMRVPEKIAGYPVVALDRLIFDEQSEYLTDLYIPKTVLKVSPSIFRWGMGNKSYCGPISISIEVAPENPMYSSYDGALYTKDGKVLCYGLGTLPATFERFYYDPTEHPILEHFGGTFDIDPENKSVKWINGLLCSADGKTLIFAPLTNEPMVIPEGIETIAEGAFSAWGCGNKIELYLPASLSAKAIPYDEFVGCCPDCHDMYCLTGVSFADIEEFVRVYQHGQQIKPYLDKKHAQ